MFSFVEECRSSIITQEFTWSSSFFVDVRVGNPPHNDHCVVSFDKSWQRNLKFHFINTHCLHDSCMVERLYLGWWCSLRIKGWDLFLMCRDKWIKLKNKEINLNIFFSYFLRLKTSPKMVRPPHWKLCLHRQYLDRYRTLGKVSPIWIAPLMVGLE